MKNLIKYLIITFAITWIFWWIEAIIVKFTPMKQNELIPMILFTVGGFGPTIAAFFCIEKKLSIKNIVQFIFGCSKKSIIFLLILIILESIVFGLTKYTKINVYMIPLILLQTIFIYGGNEELGWRGIMQPELQKKLPYLLATLIIGIVWAIWHLPLWFIEGNSHQGTSFILFAILAILMSYWLSAIINSKGSVFYCMILHGVTNTLLSIFLHNLNWIFILGLITITAVAILINLKGDNNRLAKRKNS